MGTKYNIGDKVIHVSTGKKYTVKDIHVGPVSVEGLSVISISYMFIDQIEGEIWILEDYLEPINN